MSRFLRYQLRTTDLASAHAFYTSILGRDDPTMTLLPEQARARGARPHWLGFIEVEDVPAKCAAFVARGATQLGPPWRSPDGLEAAVLRDPGGAVVALGRGPALAPPVEVVRHLLNTADVEQAKLNYAELFGWHFAAPLELGPSGVVHPFAWRSGEANVGAFVDLAGRAAVHPHWLFAFESLRLDRAISAVRSHGGLALGPLALPNGDALAVCDDAQGAAFGLLAQTSKSSSEKSPLSS
jgi:predicted enzyme related to lactoylglutathione lyase